MPQELVSAKYLWNDDQVALAPSEPAVAADLSNDIRYTRSLLQLPLFLAVMVPWYFLLPLVQAALVPPSAESVGAMWLMRPNAWYPVLPAMWLGAITAWFATIPLRKKWKAEDAAVGRPEPAVWIKVVVYLFTFKYLVVFGFLSTLYFSWSAVTDHSIDVRTPWAARSYSFAQITSLRLEPLANLFTPNPRAKYRHEVEFNDGRTATFNVNEHLSETDLSAMATFLSKRTGKVWHVTPAKRRKR